MRNTALIIVDDLADWQPYHPSQSVMSAREYMQQAGARHRGTIINLCADLSYLSTGYYVSLLAEARGQRALPSAGVMNDLANLDHYQLFLRDMSRQLNRYSNSERASILICFGQTESSELTELARHLFEAYPCPTLQATFIRNGQNWTIEKLSNRPLNELNDEQQTLFANALDAFNKRVWRKARARKEYRYDLAILHDPDEKIPTSDKKALQKFIQAARYNDMDSELITADDYSRLLEFDALFIRETTRINHHTYRFAKKAQANGLVVIDSPEAILKCANKVFLHELLEKNKVPMPRSELLIDGDNLDYAAIGDKLGYPVVLKIPDGAFSIGVEKASNEDELRATANRLFEKSTILLAQEFMRTDFDWRIGVLNNRAVYACKYYMARNHWQIYNHAESSRHRSGDFECMGVHQVPKEVIKVALQATRLIGDGLYGVDMKEAPGGPVIIEVNDNPSIDHGVEDLHLSDELYRIIMADFVRRLEH
ncbi:RimK family alpha-L-glutamate ligase [Aliidiomarina sedimenti]|uniref:RimK family alpha-L-glutamate ligase n=1 Tax=Aliidiomarina sedimenti TaxID=1933879 RepID=A0ABY0BV25_9GAMM|nr:RimK family protein [Aliidiomarina sedimenti]RUO28091.1 RimK family alpha-L-glutamate ligase [Aliidiomarina sedimenti]